MKNNNAIVHFELPADDVHRAQEFYKKIFGWSFNKFDMPENSSTGGEPYFGITTAETDENHMLKHPGAINGGLMKRANSGQMLTNYINVDSIDTSLVSIEENGGSVMMPKTEIAQGMGWVALFTDTEGNVMGLHEMPEEMKKMS